MFALRIGASHVHQGYQNAFTTYILSTAQHLNPIIQNILISGIGYKQNKVQAAGATNSEIHTLSPKDAN